MIAQLHQDADQRKFDQLPRSHRAKEAEKSNFADLSHFLMERRTKYEYPPRLSKNHSKRESSHRLINEQSRQTLLTTEF